MNRVADTTCHIGTGREHLGTRVACITASRAGRRPGRKQPADTKKARADLSAGSRTAAPCLLELERTTLLHTSKRPNRPTPPLAGFFYGPWSREPRCPRHRAWSRRNRRFSETACRTRSRPSRSLRTACLKIAGTGCQARLRSIIRGLNPGYLRASWPGRKAFDAQITLTPEAGDRREQQQTDCQYL